MLVPESCVRTTYEKGAARWTSFAPCPEGSGAEEIRGNACWRGYENEKISELPFAFISEIHSNSYGFSYRAHTRYIMYNVPVNEREQQTYDALSYGKQGFDFCIKEFSLKFLNSGFWKKVTSIIIHRPSKTPKIDPRAPDVAYGALNDEIWGDYNLLRP